jgi:hypothetical protein
LEKQGAVTEVATRQNGVPPWESSALWAALIRLHDLCFSDKNKGVLKHLIVKVSIAGFALHLVLIFLAQRLGQPPLLTAVVGDSYLSAITTPFSFILFYEVLTLIAAMSAATTRSIANQFEIVSLIFLRDVFKDIANAREPDWIQGHPHEALPLLFDMAAALSMFGLATVFRQVALRQVPLPSTPELIAGRQKFIAQKKVVAIALSALLLALATYHLGGFAAHLWSASPSGRVVTVEATNFFYNDLFNVMIFTDVVVLILSLVVSGRYEMVFRNAAFVIAVILIRFSLTEAPPYGAALALFAMVFGILTLLVFNYHSGLRAAELENAGRRS